MTMESFPASVEVSGARVHNLKNISVKIPLEKWTVVTGVSGAGKSSLVFDTIHAEAQRRYIETLSPSSRLFLQQWDRPDVDRIDQLPLTVAVEQNSRTGRGQTNLAEQTEILDQLAFLAVQVGEMYCPACQIPVTADNLPELRNEIANWPQGTRFQIAVAIAEADLQPGETWADLKKHWEENGFHRFWEFSFEAGQTKQVEAARGVLALVIVDRLVAGQATSERITESLEQAFAIGNQHCVLLREAGRSDVGNQAESAQDSVQKSAHGRFIQDERGRDWLLRFCSLQRTCQSCQARVPDFETELFERYSGQGSCETCQGAGEVVVKPRQPRRVCSSCAGLGLNAYARNVRLPFSEIAEKSSGSSFSFQQCLALSVTEFQILVETFREKLAEKNHEPSGFAVRETTEELRSRLGLLSRLGLGYLTLDRVLTSLSQGEWQRIGLVVALAGQLSETLLLLEEPARGLHPHDCQQVIELLKNHVEQGNSVLMVEHQQELIRQADQVIDLGPVAGAEGGEVLFSGSVRELERCEESSTGRWLAGKESLPEFLKRPIDEKTRFLEAEGIQFRYLKGGAFQIPLQQMTLVTGVSGSGKTSLICEALYPLLQQELQAESVENSSVEARDVNSPVPRIRSWKNARAFDQCLLVDEGDLTGNQRSTPVTYLKAYSEIRQLFSETVDAQAKGYSPGQFSFNTSQGGRCQRCSGTGEIEVNLHFLANLHQTCPECKGARFDAETRSVKFRNRGIDEVLLMTADEAFAFFRNQPAIIKRLQAMRDVGLGYLPIGSSLTRLSPGERQRLKLASLFSVASGKHVLYLFDEPSSGLHPSEVVVLARCLRRLVEQGHTVVAIDHQPLMLEASDWQLEMGPGPAEQGGQILYQGVPRTSLA